MLDRCRRARHVIFVLVVATAVASCSSSSKPSPASSGETLPSAVSAPDPGESPVTRAGDLAGPSTAPTTTARGGGKATTTTAPPKDQIYVDAAGNDANPGTADRPLRSLTTAAGRAHPGDTIFVRSGDYPGGAVVGAELNGVNGTSEKWIVIRGIGPTRPRITGGRDARLLVQKSSYVEIRGLELVGDAEHDNNEANGIEIRASHHIRLADNVAHGLGGGGIGANDSNHLDIVGNVVWSTSFWSRYQTSGISTFQSRNIGGGDDADGFSQRIVGNVVYGVENRRRPTNGGPPTDGNCIILDWQDPVGYTGRTLVANNVCFDNGGRGVHVYHSSHAYVVNNTLVRNARSTEVQFNGELSAGDATDVLFRNNLVVPAQGAKEVMQAGKSRDITFDANLYVGPRVEPHGDTDRVAPDAGMVGVDTNDFRLTPASAALGAGQREGAPTVDVLGADRPASPSVGAYEMAR